MIHQQTGASVRRSSVRGEIARAGGRPLPATRAVVMDRSSIRPAGGPTFRSTAMRRALQVVLLQAGAARVGACNACSESGASPSAVSADAAPDVPDARPDHGYPTPDANKPDSDSGPYDSGGDAGQPPPGCGASSDPEEAARWEGWVPVCSCPDGCAV